MSPVAVLDANILFPMILRDTLLRVAAAGCFRPQWSDRILDETTRNLIDQHRVSAEQAQRLVAQMAMAFPEALVEGWETLEGVMPNDPKDRHVTAAAVHCGASYVVTANLDDFVPLPAGIAAISPDAFLCDRFAETPDKIRAALGKQAAAYRRPPATITTLLDWLERDLPRFVGAVRSSLIAKQLP